MRGHDLDVSDPPQDLSRFWQSDINIIDEEMIMMMATLLWRTILHKTSSSLVSISTFCFFLSTQKQKNHHNNLDSGETEEEIDD